MQKRVIVHVGPPKTGTSAIQYWFTKHRHLLADIYYPEHGLDQNNISSGHADLILDRLDNRKTTVSVSRLSDLLATFKSSTKTTLFLSSEYFSKHVVELSKRIDIDVEFLFYLRDPIERQQSTYIQGVKRHNATIPFYLPSIFRLKMLDEVASWQKAGAKIVVRPYGQEFYSGGDIISDVFAYLNTSLPKGVGRPEWINRTYGFEALEFKRYCNHFPIDRVEASLDRALQAFTGGTQEYTLFNEAKQSKLRSRIAQQMRKFIESEDEKHLAGFIQSFESSSVLNKTFCVQSEADLSVIKRYLQTHHNSMYKQLKAIVQAHSFLMSPGNCLHGTFGVPFRVDTAIKKLVSKLINDRNLSKLSDSEAVLLRDEAFEDAQKGRAKLAMAKLLIAAKQRPFGERIISEYNLLAIQHYTKTTKLQDLWQRVLVAINA